MLKTYKLPLGIFQTNCYIKECGKKECIAVDIGGSSEKFIGYLKEKELDLRAILLTHGHYDHIMGVESVQKYFNVPVYIHEKDKICLENAEYNVSRYISGHDYIPDLKNVLYVSDGDILEFGGMKLKVIHTPGHTMGSVCFDSGEELFSGDTLFAGSRGRTDFPGSCDRDMRNSLLRLRDIDEERIVYPGHGENTTLSFERMHNINMR